MESHEQFHIHLLLSFITHTAYAAAQSRRVTSCQAAVRSGRRVRRSVASSARRVLYTCEAKHVDGPRRRHRKRFVFKQ